jgi:hypothetical protein
MSLHTVQATQTPTPSREFDRFKVVRWTGWFGLAGVILFAIELPFWIVPSMVSGSPPQISDAIAYSHYLASLRVIALTRVLLDIGMYATLLVFFAGLRHLIIKVRQEYEWLGTLALVAGAVWWAVTLVADGLEGAAVLDTLRSPDPTAIRTLVEGTLLIFNGSIAFAVTGLFMAAAGYAIVKTQALSKWIGWFACVSAGLCLVAIPSMYATVVDHNGFYNPAGWGATIVANVPPLIWFLVASLAMIRKR